MKPVILVALTLAMTAPTSAQEHGAHGGAAVAPDLPAICLAKADTMDSMAAGHTASGDAAHQSLMAGMDKMNADMMVGGTATDIDVAFVCSMIPHHRGAIDMARAELQYGDDEWARTLAQQVIDAQEKEIAEMLAWLETQPR